MSAKTVAMIAPSRLLPHLLLLVVLALLGVLHLPAAAAQPDTLPPIELPAALVTAPAPKLQTARLRQFDSTELQLLQTLTLTELLESHTAIFLKTYAAGGLATAALRGTGAAHTALVWNGFNLKNPMNGVVDFSLFPLAMADEVRLLYGGASELHGSGAIGGAIMLDDRLPEGPGLQVHAQLSAGSFGDFRQALDLGISGNKSGSRLKAWHHRARNDFPYGPGQQRLTNAATNGTGLSWYNCLRTSSRQQLESFAWLQQSNRQIPPSVTETDSKAQQLDRSARYALRWTTTHTRSTTSADVAWLHDFIRFSSLVVDTSESQSGVVQVNLRHRRQAGRHALSFASQWEKQQASTRETGLRHRTNGAIQAGWQWHSPTRHLFAEAFLRHQWSDGKPQPLTGSLGTIYRGNQAWQLTARLYRSFNLPTFNDLYWQDAFARGNPDLEPEQGWGAEAGFSLGNSDQSTGLEVRFYAMRISDWILWAPIGTIWQPQNKRRVHARGIELAGHFRWAMGQLHWKHRLETSFTRSTVAAVYDESQSSQVGKQLIYTPLVSAALVSHCSWSKLTLGAIVRWTGRRFTTTDNDPAYALPGYLLVHLQVSSRFRFLGQQWQGHATLRNALGTDYELIAARPMPGRHVQVGLRWYLAGE